MAMAWVRSRVCLRRIIIGNPRFTGGHPPPTTTAGTPCFDSDSAGRANLLNPCRPPSTTVVGTIYDLSILHSGSVGDFGTSCPPCKVLSSPSTSSFVHDAGLRQRANCRMFTHLEEIEETRQKLVLSENRVRQLEAQVSDEQQSSASRRKRVEELEIEMRRMRRELDKEKASTIWQDEKFWIQVMMPSLEEKDVFCYTRCNKCGRSCNDRLGTKFVCSSCHNQDAVAVARALVNIMVSDKTGSMKITASTSEVELMIGMNIDAITSLKKSFGMLIEFLFEQCPEWEDGSEITINDLEAAFSSSAPLGNIKAGATKHMEVSNKTLSPFLLFSKLLRSYILIYVAHILRIFSLFSPLVSFPSLLVVAKGRSKIFSLKNTKLLNKNQSFRFSGILVLMV